MKNTTTQEISVSTTLYASATRPHAAQSPLGRSRLGRGLPRHQPALAAQPPGTRPPRRPAAARDPAGTDATGGQQASWLGVPSWSGRGGTGPGRWSGPGLARPRGLVGTWRLRAGSGANPHRGSGSALRHLPRGNAPRPPLGPRQRAAGSALRPPSRHLGSLATALHPVPAAPLTPESCARCPAGCGGAAGALAPAMAAAPFQGCAGGNGGLPTAGKAAPAAGRGDAHSPPRCHGCGALPAEGRAAPAERRAGDGAADAGALLIAS